jgi:hypothetical protein
MNHVRLGFKVRSETAQRTLSRSTCRFRIPMEAQMTTRHNLHTRAALTLLGILVVATIGAHAQDRSGPIEEVRAPEVFGHIGSFRAASDEGLIGIAPSYGGAVTIPISRRLAADLDYQTSHVTRTASYTSFLFTYETRRSLFVTSLLYRFGRELVSGFIGGGIGEQRDDSIYRQDFRPESTPRLPPRPAGSPETPSGVVETHTSDVGGLTSFRGGFVAFPTRHLGVRGELYMAGWHLGARIGVGYRFN